MGYLLQSTECCDGLGFEVDGAGDAGAGDAVVLDVLPDPLVGVEFGCVAGQEHQLQPAVGGGDERRGRGGAVGGVAVDDEVDRPVGVVQQAPGGVDEHACGEVALVDGEPQ